MFKDNRKFAYRNAAFIGTACRIAHIVPVTVTESSLVFYADLENFTFVPWLNLSVALEDWVEGRDYGVYSKFTDDDNVPTSTSFIIINEPQNNQDFPSNDYIDTLIHSPPTGPAWKGNMLIFKINPLEIVDVVEDDIPVIRHLITL